MKNIYAITLLFIVAVQNLSAQLSATINSTNPSCTGSKGSAGVTASGGSNYTYKWSNGATTQSISNLGAGTYTVTVYSGGATNWDSVYFETFDSSVQTWSINVPTGSNGNASNYWDISDSCIGNGAIGTCVDNTYSPAVNANKSLFITAQPNSYGITEYAGARYDAGGSILGQSLCGTLNFCTASNTAAQSPNIKTTGTHNLVLSFQYTAGGNALIDNASLLYSINGGTSFTILDSSLKSNNSPSCNADGDVEGNWAYASYVLPASCVNITGLVIRFNWTNDGLDACSCASDPSIAVDNVTLRDSVPSGGADSIVKTVTLIPTGGLTAPVISANPDSVCSGDSVPLCPTPQTYASYSWNIGDTTPCITVTFAGAYYVTVKDTAGCSAVSDTVQIGIYKVSSVTVSVSGDTLTSYPANAYQWYKDTTKIAGANSAAYVATTSGSYAVEITDTHGCHATSNLQNIVIGGITLPDAGPDFAIYPNPVNDEMVLITSPVAIGTMIEIFDAAGRKVLSSQIRTVQSNINVAQLSTGVYVIKVGAIVKRMVKE